MLQRYENKEHHRTRSRNFFSKKDYFRDYLTARFIFSKIFPNFVPYMTQNTKYVPTELGTRSVARLLFQYALPAIIAMTASSMLNIIDRFFISRVVGADAISGLGATMPFMNLGAAFGAMVGVGAGAVMSIRLGQRDYETAQKVLGNTISLNIIISLIVTFGCLLFLSPLLLLFGASTETIQYAYPYMVIILGGGIITHSYLGLNSVIRSAGHPLFSMICTITTVLSNAVLDWLFVWVLRWGIEGAAWATILAQGVGLAMQFCILSKKDETIRLKKGIYHIRLDIVRQILVIGLSPFLMNLCACMVVIIINNSMRYYGGIYAVGAYSIVNGIIFFFLMIVMGINQGMQPIVGYNWGARQNDRVWQCLRYSIFGATVITTIGFIIGECYPELLTRIFSDGSDEGSKSLLLLSTRGFRLCVAALPLVGAQMVIGNFFQSIGHAAKSIFLSLTRQLLFLIPGLLILPRFWGLDGVWAALPASDIISFTFATSMLWWLYKRIGGKEA